ncbi:cytochrome P450 [Gaertneriomyces semiglobifer]|nr:cytochrome P450 [Gaertneriomyces semiglobifer]
MPFFEIGMASMAWSPTILITVALIAVSVFLLDLSRQSMNDIPGPKPAFLVGNTIQILPYRKRSAIHEYFAHLYKTYGPIAKFSAAGKNVVLVTNANAAKTLLFSPSVKRGPILQDKAKGLFFYGLFAMPTDAEWKRHRKFLQPGFGPSHLREALKFTDETCNTLIANWKSKTKTKTFETDMFRVASCITADVIGYVAYHQRFKSVESLGDASMEVEQNLKAYNSVFDLISKRMALPEFLWKYKGLGTDSVKNELHILHKLIDSTINVKVERKKATASKEFREKIVEEDVLDRLLENTDFTKQEIKDEVIALFLAGGETSANTIVWVVLLLHNHPEVRKRLLQEIDQVLQPNGSVTEEIIKKLTYTEWVIKEALRLHPGA